MAEAQAAAAEVNARNAIKEAQRIQARAANARKTGVAMKDFRKKVKSAFNTGEDPETVIQYVGRKLSLSVMFGNLENEEADENSATEQLTLLGNREKVAAGAARIAGNYSQFTVGPTHASSAEPDPRWGAFVNELDEFGKRTGVTVPATLGKVAIGALSFPTKKMQATKGQKVAEASAPEQVAVGHGQEISVPGTQGASDRNSDTAGDFKEAAENAAAILGDTVKVLGPLSADEKRLAGDPQLEDPNAAAKAARDAANAANNAANKGKGQGKGGGGSGGGGGGGKGGEPKVPEVAHLKLPEGLGSMLGIFGGLGNSNGSQIDSELFKPQERNNTPLLSEAALNDFNARKSPSFPNGIWYCEQEPKTFRIRSDESKLFQRQARWPGQSPG